MFANTPLEELNVGCNKLTSIPAEVGSISTLKVLWAEDNQIAEIPEALFELQKLEVLRISGNQIPTIPAGLAKLQALHTFAVDNNFIAEIPAEIVFGLSEYGKDGRLSIGTVEPSSKPWLPMWIYPHPHYIAARLPYI